VNPEDVATWIADNLLDSDAWDRATPKKQELAVVQAERNLTRWYPDQAFDVSVVAYQAVWELQGIDPALKYQKHNVKTVQDNGETVTYKDGERPVVSPDVHELLGPTADELAEREAAEEAQRQYGGALI
jgi:hypothetical protein